MPYIIDSARKFFDEKPYEAKTDGDVTYVFYKVYLAMWKKEPRWTTYALMRKSLKNVYIVKEVADLVKGLAHNGVSALDMGVAAEAAIDEIKRQYVDKYEDAKIAANGGIE